MSEQLEVLRLVTAQLDGLGIPYMVTGSLATSHYAMPRFTRDIDIVVDLDEERARRLATALAREFYVDEEGLLRAVARRGMVNVIHQHLLVKVDVIVRKDEPYRLEEFRRRRRVRVENTDLWFAAPEDVILSKLVWLRESGSGVQRLDLENLAAVKDLDRAYIERWAGELRVLALWREVADAESNL